MRVRKLAAITTVMVASLIFVGCDPVDTSSTQGKHTTSKTSGTKTKHTTTRTSVTQSKRVTSKTSGTRSRAAGSTTTATSYATVKITASDDVCWAGQINGASKIGCGSSTVQLKDPNGTYTVSLHKTRGNGNLTTVVIVDGKRVDSESISGSSGVISISYAESH